MLSAGKDHDTAKGTKVRTGGYFLVIFDGMDLADYICKLLAIMTIIRLSF